jgi:hypothetical protein
VHSATGGKREVGWGPHPGGKDQIPIVRKQRLFEGLSAEAHLCNPSYSGGRDWEDCDLRQAWAKRRQDPISTNQLVWWYLCVIPGTQEA